MIPSHLLGTEEEFDRSINFKERRLDTSTKAQALSADDLAQARKELDRGFGQNLDVENFDREPHLPLPMSVFSASTVPMKAPSAVFTDVLKGVVGLDSAEGQGEVKATAKDNSEEVKARTAAGSGEPVPRVGIKSSRNSAKKTLCGTLDKNK